MVISLAIDNSLWYDNLATQNQINADRQGMCFCFGKNAFSALRSLWAAKGFCVATNGAAFFGV